MLDFTLDALHSVLYVRPHGPLAADDFRRLAAVVDPYIEATGDLRGLILETSSFPGWESLKGMTAHFRFVRDHHRRIKKVAVVTDSVIGELAEHLASHFVAAEIHHFPAGELAAAERWIREPAEARAASHS